MVDQDLNDYWLASWEEDVFRDGGEKKLRLFMCEILILNFF